MRGRQLPPRLLVLPLLQSLSTFFHRACLQTEDLPASGSNRCGGLRPSQSKWIPILKFRRMLAIMQARAAVRTNAHLYTSKNANLFPLDAASWKEGLRNCPVEEICGYLIGFVTDVPGPRVNTAGADRQRENTSGRYDLWWAGARQALAEGMPRARPLQHSEPRHSFICLSSAAPRRYERPGGAPNHCAGSGTPTAAEDGACCGAARRTNAHASGSPTSSTPTPVL